MILSFSYRDINNNARFKKDSHTKTHNHTQRIHWTYIIWIPSNIILMRTRFDNVQTKSKSHFNKPEKERKKKNSNYELPTNCWIIQVQFLNWCNHGWNHWLVKLNTIDLEASAMDIPKETTFTYTLTFRNKYELFFPLCFILVFQPFNFSAFFVYAYSVFYLFSCLQIIFICWYFLGESLTNFDHFWKLI